MSERLRPRKATALRVALALTGAYGGWTLTFADPSYRQSTSLILASRFLPLQFWGVLLFIYAALLLTDIGDLGRICGYALGAGIAGYFAASYGWTIFHPVPGKGRNGLALAFLIDVAIYHVASIPVTIERRIGQRK